MTLPLPAMEKFVIEVLKRQKKSSNVYLLNVKLTNCNNPGIGNALISSRIEINDKIDFQAKLVFNKTDSIQYFVKFTKKVENDGLIYRVQHEFHNPHVGLNEVKRPFLADGMWQLFKDDFEIDVTLIATWKFCITIDPMILTFSVIYNDTDHTDFQLRGDDGSVHMHKAVAAYCSPFFKTLFAGTWKETADGVVQVPDTSRNTLQYLKDYMYLGQVPECVDLKQLLLLSSCYMMPDLEARCVYLLTRFITTDNVCEYIRFAVNHNQTQFLVSILQSLRFLDAKSIKP